MRWALAWSLFWMGHAVSRLDRVDSEWLCAIWMPVYQAFMRWSDQVQGTTNKGPWVQPESEEAKHG